VTELPDWLAPLPDAQRMRATDRWAIEDQGIASFELMELAGAGLARVVDETAPDGLVVAVCGKGNNGGDGLVAARLLRDAGRDVRVVLLAEPAELTGDPQMNLERLPGEPARPWSPDALNGAGVAIDAILGTGFEGEPRGTAAEAIEALTKLDGVPIVAADVPSGVDASTGEAAGIAVTATATATFHQAKPGLWINPGKSHSGQVRVIDIAIPAGSPVDTPDVGLLRDAILNEIPRRTAGSTKFDSGYVLVAGGSRGLTGAPSLACEAAMRAGAGYVTACVPASTEPIFEQRLLEAMTRGLPDDDGAHTPHGADAVLELTQRGGALVLGPGLGRSDGAQTFARDVARRAEVPMILDADGLNAHAGALADLAQRAAPTVITPHEGELGRLLGLESAEIKARRLHHARDAATQADAIVVLKGDDTLIATAEGSVAVSAGATPALATAGTGDVLSGIVGALLAKGMDPFAAACAAVRLHALAGRRAADRFGPDGVIASDVIEAIPIALADR
jgi:ADP-dependent NAD(P)H-hydrate dehydratase / NAD(P)H-hydrate epimerase